MYEKIIIFKTKHLFLKIYYRSIRYKYGTTLRGELVGELSETVMVLIRSDLLAHLPTQFSGISSFEIPFPTISVFTKIPCHALTPNSRLPSAYENALCHFQNHLHNMSICIFSINYNYTHDLTHKPIIVNPNQPWSSHGLLHFSPKNFINSVPCFGTDQTAPHGLKQPKHQQNT